jgi:hypothetical protein
LGEYNMKMIKIALLGTAALAAVSVSAQASTASDIAALKAQVEALTAQVAANQAQTSVPAGFNLVTVGTQTASVVPGLETSKNYGTTATVISIVPSADAPAAASVEFAGYVKSAIVYVDSTAAVGAGLPFSAGTSWDVVAKTGFSITGKTDTAVGEVGVKLAYAANWNVRGGFNRDQRLLSTDGAWGWWKMTNELTLAGGVAGSLAGIGYGYDGACTCNFTDNAAAGYGHDADPAQIRLSYASGPMSAAIAVEDYDNLVVPVGSASALGVAAEVKYAGDMFSGEVSGGYWPLAVQPAGTTAAWLVGAGLSVGLGDIGKISASAGTGNENHVAGDSWWKANILASINMSEQAHAEIGFNHLERTGAGVYNIQDQNAVLAGLYYDPVKQLTMGLEGEWVSNPNAGGGSSTQVDLVTVFRF